MNIEVLADSQSVAERAASVMADYAWDAIASRGTFTMAVSGGHTPWIMLRRLAAAQIPWRAVHIFQVDERVAPAGHTDRNLTHLRARALPPGCSTASRLNFMRCSVESAGPGSSRRFLRRPLCGRLPGLPGVLDLWCISASAPMVTASVAGAGRCGPRCRQRADVALSGPYQGRRRMTLTLPDSQPRPPHSMASLPVGKKRAW